MEILRKGKEVTYLVTCTLCDTYFKVWNKELDVLGGAWCPKCGALIDGVGVDSSKLDLEFIKGLPLTYLALAIIAAIITSMTLSFGLGVLFQSY